MVLKGTKRSLRTGNTLRQVRSEYTRDKSSRYVTIIRHSANLSRRQSAHEADEFLPSADAVEFSLNKKGRWNLPGIIEASIRQDEYEDVHVSMLQRHRINRQSNCFQITASSREKDRCHIDSTIHRKKARRKTYCNGLNVLNSGRGKSTKEKKKKQVVSTKHDLAQRELVSSLASSDPVSLPGAAQSEPSPEIQYNVFYPIPTTSSLRFNTKFSAGAPSPHDGIQQRLRASPGLQPNKGSASHHRHKHINYESFYDDELECVHDELDDEDEELEADHHFHRCQYGAGWQGEVSSANSAVLFSDVMQYAFQMAFGSSDASAGSLVSRRKKSRRARCGKKKGHYFYEPESLDAFDSCLEDADSDVSTELETVPSCSLTLPQNTHFPITAVTSSRVKLTREATSRLVLQAQYGPNYTEAACWPRKIIIDITDRVRDALRYSSCFRDVYLPSLDLTTYIVFSYVCPADQGNATGSIPSKIISNFNEAGMGPKPSDEINEDLVDNANSRCASSIINEDIFCVQLNMNCSGQEPGLSMPCDLATFEDVDEVVRQVLNYVITLSPEQLAHHSCEATPCALESRLKPDFDIVSQVNGWRASCVSLSDVVKLESGLPQLLGGASATGSEQSLNYHPDDDNSSLKKPAAAARSENSTLAVLSNKTYCRVCFEDVYSDSGLYGLEATALRECQHWICDSCWRTHLTITAMEAVTRKLACPEFGCGAEVDLGTLLSLLHVRHFLVRQRRSLEVTVTRMFLSKWCPNPQCGRVLQLTGLRDSQNLAEPTSMACLCGLRFCFRCLGVPHWPLSCEQLRRYHDQLQNNGDLETQSLSQSAVVVHGKSCPSCRTFIEKDGGCPYMTCVCGHSFWWCCKKKVTENHKCSNFFQVTDRTNTVKRVIKSLDPSLVGSRSSWYEMAVHHRVCQRPEQLRQMTQQAGELGKRLQVLAYKGADTGVRSQQISSGNALAVQRKDTPASVGLGEDTKVKQFCDCCPLVTTSDHDLTNRHARAIARSCWKSSPTSSVPTVWTQGQTGRHLKQTVLAMMKMKSELHNVIEHTAALIHLHLNSNLTSSAKVKVTLERLVFQSSSLDLLFNCQSRRELCHVLPWFRRLQYDVKDTMTTLARALASQSDTGPANN